MLATTASIAAHGFGQPSAVSSDKPNIIIIVADDVGVMDTSVPFLVDDRGQPKRYPLNEFYRTPNLERLARQGTRFDTFYAMSVCSPTRISLMTGQTSARHRTTNWINPSQNNRGQFGPPEWRWQGIDESTQTLPRLLVKAGYRTIHCGKGHFGPIGSSAADPSRIGFEIDIGGSAIGQPGSYLGNENFGNELGKPATFGVPDLEQYHGRSVFLTEVLTEEFNEAIEQAVNDGVPFFGCFAHYAAHAPFQADSRFIHHYPNDNLPLAAFATLIEGIDESFGDILDKLDCLGVSEQTLIFFVGDNGTDAPRGDPHAVSCAAPLRGKKATQYEGGMRVPFVAAWARPAKDSKLQQEWAIEQDAVRAEMRAIYDLFPTILSVTGIKSEAECDGTDLWSSLGGRNDSDDSRPFLMHFPHEHRSSYFTVLRRGNYKLIYHWRKPAAEQIELFDLQHDPSEMANLAAQEPQLASELLNAMKSELEQAGAQYPMNDDLTAPLTLRIGN